MRKEKIGAATLLQSRHRTRTAQSELESARKAATTLSAAHRGRVGRATAGALRGEMLEKQHSAATKLQSMQRAKAAAESLWLACGATTRLQAAVRCVAAQLSLIHISEPTRPY